jgi:hypothetical protein
MMFRRCLVSGAAGELNPITPAHAVFTRLARSNVNIHRIRRPAVLAGGPTWETTPFAAVTIEGK